MKLGVGNSHAKIILIGEHAVVYGQPAIALPIFAIKTRVTLAANPTLIEPNLKTSYYTGPLSLAVGQMHGIQLLINQLWQRLDPNLTPFTMTIVSDLPAERGMGSSAATAIAIIRAFFDYYHQPLKPTTLLKLAELSEDEIHGNPSGIDAATTSATTPLLFVKQQPLQPLPIQIDGYLIIIDSGQKGQTGPAVASVQNQLLSNPVVTQPRIDDLGRLTRSVAQHLAHNELQNLGQDLTAAHHDLQALDVSNDRLNHLVEVANQSGSLGSKLTGGGRGGCIIALANTVAEAQKIATATKQAGAIQTWIQSLHELSQP